MLCGESFVKCFVVVFYRHYIFTVSALFGAELFQSSLSIFSRTVLSRVPEVE